jgi:putative sterol carrier protein/NAD(P)H-dependent FMN reductase
LKIFSFFAAPPDFDLGLGKAAEVYKKVLLELNAGCEEINLSGLPFFGADEKILEIIGRAEKSDGVIFAFVSYAGSPCAVMQSFFERRDAKKFLRNKNCALITVSADKSQSRALFAAGEFLAANGAFSTVRIPLTSEIIRAVSYDDITREIFEKQIEDFYRLVRQNRKFFIIGNGVKQNIPEAPPERELSSTVPREETGYDRLDPEIPEPPRLNESALEMTRAAPARFRPEPMAKFTLQIEIEGAETFKGYFKINGKDCNFIEGETEADIYVKSGEEVWRDIVAGRKSAKKSFTAGLIKVRGNFVLLAKFDRLFSKGRYYEN